MSIDEYLTALRKNNIAINVHGNELKILASREALTEEIIEDIRKRKVDILEFFKSIQGGKDFLNIRKADEKQRYRLSSAQKRLYFLYQKEPTSVAYNMPQVLKLEGQLSNATLKDAFIKLIERHESLRTCFETIDGELFQRILPDVFFDVEYFHAKEQEVPTIVEKFIRPFDLEKDILIRAGVVEVTPAFHVLMVDMHHIISDGVSLEVFIRDFTALYNKEEMSGLKLQYKDYAEWQQEEKQQKEIIRQGDFWLKDFAEPPPALELPADFKRPTTRNNEGAGFRFEISHAETKRLTEIAAEEGATLFMTVLSMFNILLAKLCNKEDIVVGSPVAGRSHADLDGVIGAFLNTLALRNRPLGHLSFRQFLAEVKTKTLTCFQYQDYQYEDLVEALKMERDKVRNPLFDVLFSFMNFEDTDFQISGLTLSPYYQNDIRSRFDLTLYASEHEGQLFFTFQYSTSLFKRETIARFSDYLRRIISSIVANSQISLSDIEVLTDEEKRQLIFDFNDTRFDYDREKTIVDLFREQVAKHGDQRAVVCGRHHVTYNELDQYSDAVADLILACNAGPGIVAVCVRPSVDMLVAIIGILKSGSAFLPLDPDQHSLRQQNILKESGCRILLTQQDLKHNLSFSGNSIILQNGKPIDTAHTAAAGYQNGELIYVMYTSGSTGQPKGVKISNTNLINYVLWLKSVLRLSSADRSVLTSSYAFDLGYTSIFPILLAGGQLHVLTKDVYQSSRDLLEYIQSNQITYLKVTPSLFTTIIDAPNFTEKVLGSVKYILLGGEPVRVADIEKVSHTYEHIQFINHYGPTETTIGAIALPIEDLNDFKLRPTIGRPINNTSVFILDSYHNVLPCGVAGELCIGGDGVGLGYLNNDMLTGDKFVNLPFYTGGKVYKTGDVARRLRDGEIEFLGRADSQVKIRGYRIELGEIESRLAAYDKITKAVVVVKEKGDNKFLVAYYVSDRNAESAQLKDFLSAGLPDYMVPAHFMRIDALPLTPNGKLNRKALPEPETEAETIYVAPSGPIEQKLVEVWCKVLSKEKISVTDNFFAIGGDSIKSIMISGRMRGAGYKVSVNDIFTYQNIRELSKHVAPVAQKIDHTRPLHKITLLPVQRRFFANALKHKHHYNQSVILNFADGISLENVQAIFDKLQQHHEALRMIFRLEGNAVVPEIKNDQSISIQVFGDRNWDGADETFLSEADKLQGSIDLVRGPLIKLGLFHWSGSSRLLIVIHHLIVDGVSWRLLFEDIEALLSQINAREPLSLPIQSDSLSSWSWKIAEYVKSPAFFKAQEYWKQIESARTMKLPRDYPKGRNRIMDQKTVSVGLTAFETNSLLTQVNAAFNTKINDILLAALFLSLKEQYKLQKVKIDIEGHGREDTYLAMNVSRTVGWFTSIYPVIFEDGAADLASVIKRVKETLRMVPNKGIDYLMMRYPETMTSYSQQADDDGASICFNFLGEFGVKAEDGLFSITYHASRGKESALDEMVLYDWNISGMIAGGELEMSLSYSDQQYENASIGMFMDSYKRNLERIIAYCSTYGRCELTPSDLTYKKLTIDQLNELEQKYALEDIYPLSPMQEGLLFHSLLDEGSQSYFEQKTFYLKGKLNAPAVEKSLDDLVARYEVFRTLFLAREYERPLQVVLKDRKADFVYKDIISRCLDGNQDKIVELYRSNDRARTFDLSTDMLLRVILLQTSEDEYVFIWSHHHILMDGWCSGIVWRDFQQLYQSNCQGDVVDRTPAGKYAVYIDWLEGLDKRDSLRYWENHLASYDALAALPKKDSQLAQDVSHEHQSKLLIVDESLANLLQKVATSHEVTLNSVIQTAWAILLMHYNDVTDVVFGSVVSGRPAEIGGVENMIGLFINTIPVRVAHKPVDTLGDLLKSVQLNATAGTPHHYQPLSEIQALSTLGRGLMDSIIVFENYPVNEMMEGHDQSDKYRVTNIEIFEQTSYDLSLIVVPEKEIFIKFSYNPIVYSAETIDRASVHLNKILKELAFAPEKRVCDMTMVTELEERQLLFHFNDTAAEYPTEGTILDLFWMQVEKAPDNIALTWHDRKMSYRELRKKANQIAAYLHEEASVEKGDLIGLMLERDEYLIPCIFGITEAGAAYVPIDPGYPAERINAILEDSGVNTLVTRRRHLSAALKVPTTVVDLDEVGAAIDARSEVSLGKRASGRDLAYVIYTSGSTGRPKGVMIEHHSLVNRILWMQKNYPLTASDVLLQKTPIVFDVSLWELFWWSITGASLCLLKPNGEKDPAELMDAIKENGVTTIHFVPSMLNGFLSVIDKDFDFSKLNSLRQVFASGEALKTDHVRLFGQSVNRHCGTRLINLYGPTEATVDVSFYECAFDERVVTIPIGKPIDNIQLYVLDKSKRLLPIGAVGELCIAGVGVARGYLHNQALTDEKFISNPFTPGGVLYKTGDLARWASDGSVEFLGRIDHQVKIRGLRIELGEIEHHLLGSSLVQEAAVVVNDKGDDRQLVAYYVPDPEAGFTINKILLAQREVVLPIGMDLHEFVNGLSMYAYNKQEAQFLYEEIFEDDMYLREGITIPENGCIFDVGANLGMFSLYANLVARNVEVYAFEPLPPIFALLKANTSLYCGNFRLFNCGLSDVDGEAIFNYYYPKATVLSGSSDDRDAVSDIVRQYIRNTEQDGEAQLSETDLDALLKDRLVNEQYACAVTTITRVIAENNLARIDLLKIDVENSELKVLRGIGDSDWNIIHQIVLEVHDIASRLKDVVELLGLKGYDVSVTQSKALKDTSIHNVYALHATTGSLSPKQERKTLNETGWLGKRKYNERIKKYLIEKLPEYMVPSIYVPVAAMPLTANGKLDRKALPTPAMEIGGDYVSASTDVQERIIQIWSAVLGIGKDKIGVNANFFELGGHSIALIKLSNMINAAFGSNISVSRMFSLPNILKIEDYLINGDQGIGKVADQIDEALDEANDNLKLMENLLN